MLPYRPLAPRVGQVRPDIAPATAPPPSGAEKQFVNLLLALGGAAGAWLGIRVAMKEKDPWARAGGWFVALDSITIGGVALLSLIAPALARSIPLRIMIDNR